MGKNRKVIIILLTFFVLIFVLPVVVMIALSSSDYARITAAEYRAVLSDKQAGGTRVHVTERLTFDIHASSTSNRYWELWRDLPEEWENGVRVVGYDVISVKRISVDGQSDYLEFGKASRLYDPDSDYVKSGNNQDLSTEGLGPNRWFHSKGPYDDYYNFECLMIYVDGLYRETVVFEIEYEIYGAAVRYADCSELYLPMYSGSGLDYFTNLSAEILIPTNKMPRDENYHAWTYGTTAHEIPFETSKSKNAGFFTFSFSLDEDTLKFKPYNRYVEFSLVAYGADKHIFTQYAPSHAMYNDNVYQDVLKAQDDYEKLPERYKAIKRNVLIVFIIISLLVFAIIYLIHAKFKAKKEKPDIEYEFYREIPSELDVTFAGAFALCKHKLGDDVPGGFAATMLGLVRKGYITVSKIYEDKDWSESNTRLSIGAKNAKNAPNMQKPLTHGEAAHYNLICRHATAGVISLSSLQQRVASDYEATDAFIKKVKGSVKNTGISKGYFKEADYKKKKHSSFFGAIALIVTGAIFLLINLGIVRTRLDLAFGAFFILGTALIVAGIMFMLLSRVYVLLTKTGEEEYSKWRGLYNFLNSETLIKERTVQDVELWEEYLMYATAFGISEKVLKALKMNFPEYNPSSSLILRHPFLTAWAFTRVYNRSFRHATHSAAFSRISGGGGYGGGRGGGTGGGGH